MSIKLIDDTKLSAIGNAIRTKGGTAALIDIDDMPQAIADLPSGGGGFDWSQLMSTKVQVKAGVTTLDCSGIDTSSFTSMASMFENANQILHIDVGDFDTDAVTTFYGMFYGCNKIEELDLSSFDASNVTTMARMFYSCYALKTIDFGNGFSANTKLTNVSYLFYYCYQLDFSCLEDLDTSNVTDFSYMFSTAINNANRYGGTTLDLSVLNTAKATTFANMFTYCSQLTSLDVHGLDVSKVTNFSYMCSGCSSLTSLDLSTWNMASTSNISYMFNGCTNLASVNLAGLDTTRVTSSWNASSMFTNCSNLVDIIWSQKSTVQAIPTTPANMGINSNMKIYVPDDLVSSYKAASNWSTIESQIYSINDLPAAVKTLYNIS